MITKNLLFLLLLFYAICPAFCCTINYSGPGEEKIKLAMEEIKKSDPAYYKILEDYSDFITGCPFQYSTVSIADGKYWILLSSEIIERSNIKKIAATIIHESLHNFYARTGQYANFKNVNEEEVQAYSYAMYFLIEINGSKSDIGVWGGNSTKR